MKEIPVPVNEAKLDFNDNFKMISTRCSSRDRVLSCLAGRLLFSSGVWPVERKPLCLQ